MGVVPLHKRHFEKVPHGALQSEQTKEGAFPGSCSFKVSMDPPRCDVCFTFHISVCSAERLAIT